LFFYNSAEEDSQMKCSTEGLAEMVTKNTKIKVPIGTLLLADGLILPQDLEFALDHQKYSQQLLGQILVRMGALTQYELDRILKLQGRLSQN
jgi:hypothetical protein